MMVARLHSLTSNVEREWEEKDLGFLQDHAVIRLVSFKINVSDWVERNFFSMTVFGGILFAGDVHSSVAMERQHLPAHLMSTLGICMLTWGLGLYSGFSTTKCEVSFLEYLGHWRILGEFGLSPLKHCFEYKTSDPKYSTLNFAFREELVKYKEQLTVECNLFWGI